MSCAHVPGGNWKLSLPALLLLEKANSCSVIAQLIKNLPEMQETPVPFLGWEDPWRRDRLLTPVFLGFPGGSDSKECNAGDPGSIPESGRSPGGGHGNPLQYSCLKNLVDRGAWWAIVHGVTPTTHTHTHTQPEHALADLHLTGLAFKI